MMFKRLGRHDRAPVEQPSADELQGRLKRARRQAKKSRQEVERLQKEVAGLRESRARITAELEILRETTLAEFTAFDGPEPLERVLHQVVEENLTYLSPPFLRSLAGAMLETEAAGREGIVVECGTALGGSAIAIAAAKDPARPMRVFDAFGMIPPPTERDGADVLARYAEIVAGHSRGLGGESYYGYRENLQAEVAASFSRLGYPVGENHIELVKGFFEDTLVIDEPVALAHVDGDWYESTMTCLERIVPHLVLGGRIVVDDYYMWSGCRDAVDEFMAGRTGLRVEKRAKVHIVRGAAA